MIITCTSCEKKFSVPDAAITAKGRLVQCSSCGNKWTQYPLKTKPMVAKPVVTRPTVSKPISAPIKTTKPKKKISKKTGPLPYSKEYMQQKWGTSLKSYAAKKNLVKNASSIKKIKKEKNVQNTTNVSFGFFNYIIMTSVLGIFFVGILSFERSRLSRKFPLIEPYIDHFFEALEIFKIFILDFFR